MPFFLPRRPLRPRGFHLLTPLLTLLLVVPAASSLAAEAKPKTPIAHSKRSLPNGCLVDAIAYKDALDARDRLERRWSRVLILGWQEKATPKGHALCVFEFNKTIWAYDPATGTVPLTKNLALKSNPTQLAKLWLGLNASRLLWSEFP